MGNSLRMFAALVVSFIGALALAVVLGVGLLSFTAGVLWMMMVLHTAEVFKR